MFGIKNYYQLISERNVGQLIMEFKLLIENPGLDRIALKVFSNLNPSSLASCRLVAKSWCTLLTRSRIWWVAKADCFEAICNNPDHPNAQWNLEKWKLWKDAIQTLKNKDRCQFRKLMKFLEHHSQLNKASDLQYPDYIPRECLFDALRGLELLLERNEEEFVDTLLECLPTKHVRFLFKGFTYYKAEDKPDLSLLCFFVAAKSLPKLFVFILNKTVKNGLDVFHELSNEKCSHFADDSDRQFYVLYEHRLCRKRIMSDRRQSFIQKLLIYCKIDIPSMEILNLINKYMPQEQDHWNIIDGFSVLHNVCDQRPPDHMANRPIPNLISFILDHSAINAINSRWHISGETPLHLACELTGSSSAANFLLTHPDIDIYQVNDHGFNALHIACKYGQLEIAKNILAMDNTLISQRNEIHNGNTPIHYAIDSLKVDTSHPMLINMDGTQRKYFELAKYLLSLPSLNVNTQGYDGMAPLHVACQNGLLNHEPNRREAIQLLLAHPDIRVNICNATNATPLHLACQLGNHFRKHNEIVAAETLLNAEGIDIDAKDSHGNTAMDYAMQSLDEFNDNVDMLQKIQKLIQLLENYKKSH